MSRDGLVAFLELTFQGGSTDPNGGFGASETYRLVINTTGLAVPTIGNLTVNLPAGRYARIEVEGVLQLLTLRLEGRFSLEIGDASVSIFADAGLVLGDPNEPLLAFQATGFVTVRAEGFAALLELALETNFPESAGIIFDARFLLLVNTSGQSITYDILGGGLDRLDPRFVLVRADGSLAITLPGTAPGATVPGPYALVEAEGRLGIGDFFLEGFFGLTLADTLIRAEAKAVLVVPVNPGFALTFDFEHVMEIRLTGIVDVFEVTLDPLGMPPGPTPIVFEAVFALEVNTSGRAYTVNDADSPFLRVRVNQDGTLARDASGTLLRERVAMPAETVRLFGVGALILSDTDARSADAANRFEITGGFEIVVGEFEFRVGTGPIQAARGLQITANGRLAITLGGARAFEFRAEGALMWSEDGIAAQFTLSILVQPSGPDRVFMSGAFAFAMNTYSFAITQIGALPVTLDPGPYLRIEATGTLRFFQAGSERFSFEGGFSLQLGRFGDGTFGVMLGATGELLLRSNDASGTVLFSMSATGGLALTTGGFAASLSLGIGNNAQYSFGGVQLTGRFRFEANTYNRQVVIPTSPSTVVTVRSGVFLEIAVDGGTPTTNATFAVGDFSISGRFTLTVGAVGTVRGLRFEAVGTMSLPLFGTLFVNVDLTVSPSGVVASLQLGASSAAASNPGQQTTRTGSGFRFNAVMVLEINTTGALSPNFVTRYLFNFTTGQVTTVQERLPVGITFRMAGTLELRNPAGQTQFTIRGTYSLTAGSIVIGTVNLGTGLRITAQGRINLAYGATVLAEMNLDGDLLLATGGVVANMSLTFSGALTQRDAAGRGFSVNAAFSLQVKTVTNALPALGAAFNTTERFVRFRAAGSLELFINNTTSSGRFVIAGEFLFSLSTAQVGGATVAALQLGAVGTLNLTVSGTTVFSGGVNSALHLASNGIAARIVLTLNSFVLPGGSTLSGQFRLEFNTMSQAVVVGTTSIAGGPYLRVTVSGPSSPTATLNLRGVLLFTGAFFFEVSPAAIDVRFDASVSIAGIGVGSFRTTGALKLRATGSLAGSIELTLGSLRFGPAADPIFSLSGRVFLAINTGATTELGVPGGTLRFEVTGPTGGTSQATANLLNGFASLDARLFIEIQSTPGNTRYRFEGSLSGNIFGVRSTVSGFVEFNNGIVTYDLGADINVIATRNVSILGFSLVRIEFQFAAAVRISNIAFTVFSASLSGRLDLFLPFDVKLSLLPPGTATITLTRAGRFRIGDFAFNLGNPLSGNPEDLSAVGGQASNLGRFVTISGAPQQVEGHTSGQNSFSLTLIGSRLAVGSNRTVTVQIRSGSARAGTDFLRPDSGWTQRTVSGVVLFERTFSLSTGTGTFSIPIVIPIVGNIVFTGDRAFTIRMTVNSLQSVGSTNPLVIVDAFSPVTVVNNNTSFTIVEDDPQPPPGALAWYTFDQSGTAATSSASQVSGVFSSLATSGVTLVSNGNPLFAASRSIAANKSTTFTFTVRPNVSGREVTITSLRFDTRFTQFSGSLTYRVELQSGTTTTTIRPLTSVGRNYTGISLSTSFSSLSEITIRIIATSSSSFSGNVRLDNVAFIGTSQILLATTTSFTSRGFTFNNPIEDARFFYDANHDGAWNEGEPYAFTSETGGATVEFDLAAFDRNGDGFLDPSEGRWTATGGFDVVKGTPNLLTLTALPGRGGPILITPLSTLIAAVYDLGGLTPAAAEQLVRGSLLLSADTSAANYVAALQSGDPRAVREYMISAQLADAYYVLSAALQGAGAEAPDAFDAVLRQLALAVSGAEGEVDLADAALLAGVLTEAAGDVGVALEPDVVETISSLLAQSQQDLAASTADTPEDLLMAIARVQKVTQTTLASAAHDLAAGLVTVEDTLEAYSDEALWNLYAQAIVQPPVFLPPEPPILFVAGVVNGQATSFIYVTTASESYPTGQASAYYQFTLTPPDEILLTPQQVELALFGVPDAPGPWMLRSSADGFQSDLAVFDPTQGAPSMAAALAPASSGAATTYRIYGDGLVDEFGFSAIRSVSLFGAPEPFVDDPDPEPFVPIPLPLPVPALVGPPVAAPVLAASRLPVGLIAPSAPPPARVVFLDEIDFPAIHPLPGVAAELPAAVPLGDSEWGLTFYLATALDRSFEYSETRSADAGTSVVDDEAPEADATPTDEAAEIAED